MVAQYLSILAQKIDKNFARPEVSQRAERVVSSFNEQKMQKKRWTLKQGIFLASDEGNKCYGAYCTCFEDASYIIMEMSIWISDKSQQHRKICWARWLLLSLNMCFSLISKTLRNRPKMWQFLAEGVFSVYIFLSTHTKKICTTLRAWILTLRHVITLNHSNEHHLQHKVSDCIRNVQIWNGSKSGTFNVCSLYSFLN